MIDQKFIENYFTLFSYFYCILAVQQNREFFLIVKENTI